MGVFSRHEDTHTRFFDTHEGSKARSFLFRAKHAREQRRKDFLIRRHAYALMRIFLTRSHEGSKARRKQYCKGWKFTTPAILKLPSPFRGKGWGWGFQTSFYFLHNMLIINTYSIITKEKNFFIMKMNEPIDIKSVFCKSRFRYFMKLLRE